LRLKLDFEDPDHNPRYTRASSESAMRTVSAMAGLLGLVVVAHASTGPVTKVVELIEELKAKIEADGKMEQNIYDKYACWCETTTARKAENIHDAMSHIKETGTKILELKGLVATRTSEIAHDTKLMNENQAAQDEATGIRQKENRAYSGEKTEMETTLNALQRGIEVLSGSGTKTALLQADLSDEMTLLNVGAGIHEAINALPSGDTLAPKDLALISAFAKDPAEFYDQKAEKAASYNPASNTIQGILKDMYDTFSMGLEKATETEATQQKNFESLMGVKDREMQTLSAARKKREGEKAVAEKDLADNSQDLDDTTKQMNIDVIFFDETKKVCSTKADEWSERVRARTEELAGINKALEILTGDDAKALFNKSIKPGMETFLQTQSENTPAVKAYNSLKATATKTKSLRLASIAATLRLGGHFDSVVAEIDTMMNTLKAEEKDDINQRDWCKEETFKNEQEASRYEYKIERTDARLGKLSAKLENLEDNLQHTIQEIQDTKADIKSMEDTRHAEHAAYQTAKTDDEGASKLLGAAIEAMTAFYKNNNIGMGEIQGSATGLVQEPVFEVSADQAPDAGFTKSGKSAGESKGIVSIMTMIKEDLEDEIANGTKNEEKNQADYEKQVGEANQLLDDLRAKKTSLEENIETTNGSINDEQAHKEDLQGMLKEERDYLASIKPDCDWVLKSFEERRSKRAQEMEGLMEAKSMLLGASPSAAMVQQSDAFNDDEFPSMSFSTVSFLQRSK